MLQSITKENFSHSGYSWVRLSVLTRKAERSISVTQEGGEHIPVLPVGFSEDEALVTVAMDTEDEEYKITGLWGDSPNLRK